MDPLLIIALLGGGGLLLANRQQQAAASTSDDSDGTDDGDDSLNLENTLLQGDIEGTITGVVDIFSGGDVGDNFADFVFGTDREAAREATRQALTDAESRIRSGEIDAWIAMSAERKPDILAIPGQDWLHLLQNVPFRNFANASFGELGIAVPSHGPGYVAEVLAMKIIPMQKALAWNNVKWAAIHAQMTGHKLPTNPEILGAVERGEEPPAPAPAIETPDVTTQPAPTDELGIALAEGPTEIQQTEQLEAAFSRLFFRR